MGYVLFIRRDVTIVFGHHRVMRYNRHCNSGQKYPLEYNIILFCGLLGEVNKVILLGMTCLGKSQVTKGL